MDTPYNQDNVYLVKIQTVLNVLILILVLDVVLVCFWTLPHHQLHAKLVKLIVIVAHNLLIVSCVLQDMP